MIFEVLLIDVVSHQIYPEQKRHYQKEKTCFLKLINSERLNQYSYLWLRNCFGNEILMPIVILL